MQSNELKYEAYKRGIKRPSESLQTNDLLSSDIESNEKQACGIVENFKESKQIKIGNTNENVPKINKSIFSPTDANIQSSSASSNNKLSQAKDSCDTVDVLKQMQAIVVPIQETFTQEVMESFALEQHLQFLHKQQKSTETRVTESFVSNPPQYFAQIQSTSNQNLNIKSTCDTISSLTISKDAFTSGDTENETGIENKQKDMQPQINKATESQREQDDIIEQNFADAENYVLQSGDGSTDSGGKKLIQKNVINMSIYCYFIIRHGKCS